MIRFLLDTSICIELIRAEPRKALLRLRRFEVDEVAISSITLAELQYGVAKSARPGHHELLLVQFCAPLALLPFDQAAATTYGGVRAALERAGMPIGPLDTRIAAHALSIDVPLVTTHEREFRRMPGLRVDNWTKA